MPRPQSFQPKTVPDRDAGAAVQIAVRDRIGGEQVRSANQIAAGPKGDWGFATLKIVNFTLTEELVPHRLLTSSARGYRWVR